MLGLIPRRLGKRAAIWSARMFQCLLGLFRKKLLRFPPAIRIFLQKNNSSTCNITLRDGCKSLAISRLKLSC